MCILYMSGLQGGLLACGVPLSYALACLLEQL